MVLEYNDTNFAWLRSQDWTVRGLCQSLGGITLDLRVENFI